MQKKYEKLRNKIASWLEAKIFSPISNIQDFCKVSNMPHSQRFDRLRDLLDAQNPGYQQDQEWIVPKVRWKPLNLKKDRAYIKARNG